MIMAFDPSTTCTGWAVMNKDREIIACGAITPPSKLKNGQKYEYIYDAMKTLINMYNPEAIACEDQFLGLRKATLKVLSQLRGVIMLLCTQNNLEMYYYWPSTIKLVMSGKGNATKDEMIEAVNRKFDVEIKNDNIADAIAIAHTHYEKTPELTNQPKKKKKKK